MFFRKKDQYRVRHLHDSEIDDAVLTATEKEADRLEWPLNRKWLNGLWIASILCLFVLGGRIFFLNVIQGEKYREMAKKNSIRSIAIPAPRGIIYDSFGKALVSNTPIINLVVVPSDLPQGEDDRRSLFDSLGELLHISTDEINDLAEKTKARSLMPVLVKERLTQDEMLLFSSKKSNFPGFSLASSSTRNYADSLIFSHIIGYEGKIKKEELDQNPGYLLTDSIGKQGIEKSYEKDLRGISGAYRVEVDSVGIVQKELGTVSPQPGSDIILHIDAELQKKAFDALQRQLEVNGLKKGAVVALDPKTGAVLALVSYPSFDNNLFSQGISSPQYQALINDENKPLFNRVLSGEYPPGSTVKPVLAGGALAEGIIDESTQIESRGGIQIGSFFFGDWKAHGFTDVRRAIAVSSDVFFYSIGGGYGSINGLGMERMKKYYNLFGFGSETGIDIGGEADGFVPDPQWKQDKIGERWYIGDDYHASIGQGFVLATPLQLAVALSAIVNGGTLYQPQIISQIKKFSGEVTTIAPHIIQDHILNLRILNIAREGMRQTVTDGTATQLQDLPVAVAGKTGTAQFGSNKKTHGWFESFAPYDDPKIVMVVLVEDQDESGYNAVPITKEIYKWYFGGRGQEELSKEEDVLGKQ